MNWKSAVLVSIVILALSAPSVRAESPGVPLPGMPTLQDGLNMLGIQIPALPTPPSVPTPPAKAGEAYTLVTAMIAEGANLWLPSTLIIKSGASVKATLKNVSKVEHGFAIDDFGIRQIIPPGEAREVWLKPTASGTLHYYCPLHPGHIGGQLLVQ